MSLPIPFEYEIKSLDPAFPKTLLIRNEKSGGLWEIYHVQSFYEGRRIARGAMANAYEYVELVDHQPELEQTFPDWREEAKWLSQG